jgi:hypothetical protein
VKIEYKHSIDVVAFNSLKVGEVFARNEASQMIYMKIADIHTEDMLYGNAVCLDDGCIEVFKKNEKLIDLNSRIKVTVL